MALSFRLHGLRAWVLQRLSALYLLLYGLLVGARFAAEGVPGGSEAWRAFLAAPLTGAATLVLVPVLLLHAWVGVRDMLIDYLHPWRWRLAALAALAAALLLLGAWALRLLLGALMWTSLGGIPGGGAG